MRFGSRVRVIIGLLLTTISALLLAVTGTWLFVERRLAQFTPPATEAAFSTRSIGLETLPLKYALVLESVSAAAFRTGNEDGRSLWQTFGFIDNPHAHDDAKPPCVDNAPSKLPFGFEVSQYMPVTAVQTPVPFAGLTCATCHSAALRDASGGVTPPILGVANPELDVIAWSDGVRSAVLDPDLSAAKILAAYDKQCGGRATLYESTLGRWLDVVVIGAWLRAIRSQVASDLSRYDLPYHGSGLNDPRNIPAGPIRTRPFRSVVRVALNLPGAENMALSKIPSVLEQDTKLRPRSQYDGSIVDPVIRSMIAAYASGASVEALSRPEVEQNIRQAAAYTEQLGIDIKVPTYSAMFPSHAPDPARVAAGRVVYMRSCNICHGNRPAENAAWNLDGAGWIHQLSRLEAEGNRAPIGTDPMRLTFRYSDMLPLAIWTGFPGWADQLEKQKRSLADAQTAAEAAGDLATAYLWQNQRNALDLLSRKYRLGHPFYFPADGIRYDVGYINNPIPRTFLRAPFLHNGSVPTLRELINLDQRPPVFCRGQNVYDPDAIGYVAPSPDAQGKCPPRLPFRFDTSLPGNSNAGHDYPWRYDGPARDKDKLEDLLAYLKTL
jgi:cytochrome c5